MSNPMELKVGDRCKVFDGLSWSKVGDIGDNEQFWKRATIIKDYWDDIGRRLVDVKMDSGEESRCHFKHGIKPLNKTS